MISNKSKVLFITHHYLHGTGGGCFASRAYINAFATLFSDVTLLYPFKQGMEAEHIKASVKQIPVKYEKGKLFKLIDLLEGRVHRYSNIKRIIGQKKYDVLVFDTSIVSYRLIGYFKAQGSKIIVIHHNYQYEYFHDNTAIPLKIPTLFWCKRYEKDAILMSDLNLTLSKQDINLLENHYVKDLDNASFEKLGVFEYEPREMIVTHKNKYPNKSFVITGTLESYQTYESLYKWVRKYYSIFRNNFPDAQLIVAGRNPSRKLMKMLIERGIKVIPNPLSMDEILQDSQFYLCPTELGGGLKLRIMDGLRNGLPVITHKVSARGYDDFIEMGYVQSYFDKDSFNHCLQTLKSSIYDSNEIIKMYEDIFSFAAGVNRLRKILSKYIGYTADEYDY